MSESKYPSVAIHRLAELNPAQRTELLRRSEDDLQPFIEGVKPLIAAVKEEGDEALARFAKQFDHADITAEQLAATKQEMDQAFDQLDKDMIDVLEYSADNIRRFHETQLPEPTTMVEIQPGVMVGERALPIDSVACYSPRGKGSFPSVTLMTAIPAVVAGVPQAIILTPAGADGNIDPATLVAARLAGIESVFKAGGAQAVAAAAFGTQTIPRCRKIVGPGSPWLVAAKRELQGVIDPGLPAGPTETIVLADPTATSLIAALDIIIESEHGSDSSAFLVTWDEKLASEAAVAIPAYWATMSDTLAGFSSDVLSSKSGGIVIAPDAQAAYDFINDYAPEHLQILSSDPHQHLDHIRNASEILLGENAPGSMANYMMGPNCVLPTAGGAHTHSPLGVRDFIRTSSIGHVTPEGYAAMAPRVEKFAQYEGFDGHANAVSWMRGEAFKGHLPNHKA